MKRIGIPVFVLLIISVIMLAACGPRPAGTEGPDSGGVGSAAPGDTDNNVMVAAPMAALLYNIEAIQRYYDDGMTAMASGGYGKTLARKSSAGEYAVLMARPSVSVNNLLASAGFMLSYPLPYALTGLPGQQEGYNIPAEFMEPLPPSGAISPPAGACPAGAEPSVTFETAGGEAVTPQLLESLNLQTIPTEMLTMSQNDPGSLFATITEMVPVGDMSLASPEGWDSLVWDRLREMQAPAQSLMDYQLWNASPEIEQQITGDFVRKLQSFGVPPMVTGAFNSSSNTGWFASTEPTPEDALARMDILAEMTGSVSGTVHEQRDFSIPGAGQQPVFGVQTGDGTVSYNHPALGPMDFEVDILLDQFDEQGRAVGGTVEAVDAENGYTVRFVFQPDGTKKGEVLQGGEVVGLLTMSVDAEKFENYVDVQTNQSQPLPLP